MYSHRRPRGGDDQPPAAEEPPMEERVDKVFEWRFNQLVKAGANPFQAQALAEARNVDLHRAVHITKKAGPERAIEILL